MFNSFLCAMSSCAVGACWYYLLLIVTGDLVLIADAKVPAGSISL